MSTKPETFRSYLFSIAYNILGEIQEAEDMVQEAFAIFFSQPQKEVLNLKTYLARIVANKSIDRLKALRKEREQYPGVWLPEPFVEPFATGQEGEQEVMDYRVLHALESLNPVERAVFVLREAFDYPYQELAVLCQTSIANCRQIISRARKKVAREAGDAPTGLSKHLVPLIEAFQQAVVSEDPSALTSLLQEDIILYSDGGGKVAAALNPLFGNTVVTKFLLGIAKKNKGLPISVSVCLVNQQPALLLSSPEKAESLIIFSGKGVCFDRIFIIRNPAKLSRLEAVTN